MKIVTIVCFSFVIYLDSVRCMTVNEFLNSIPGWGTVRTAWDNMVVAIKKPVNLLRFGHGGRRKTTRSPLRTAKTTTTKFNASTVETIRNTTPHNLEVIPVSAKKVMTTTVVPLKPIITRIRSEKPTRHTKPPDNTKLPLKTETSITPVVTKVKLPYFAGPIWKSAEEWKDMQRPFFAIVLKGDGKSDDFEIDNIIYQSDNQMLSDIKDTINYFGALLIV